MSPTQKILLVLAGWMVACGESTPQPGESTGGGSAGSAGNVGDAGSAGGGAAGAPGAGKAGAGGASGSSGQGGGAGGAGVPGSPSADGWKKAYAKGSVGVSCDASLEQMVASGAPSLTFGKSQIFVGFQQLGNNQDPVFRRFDDGKEVYCAYHEQEGPDGRAEGFTWDGGAKAYVVYTIVGGGSKLDAAGKGQWLGSYGDGGGSSKVSFLGEVDTGSGALLRGTFILAKKKDGKTNSHGPVDAPTVLSDGTLEFRGSSAFQPMNPDKSIMECTDYPFDTSYVFSADLAKLLCSSSTNCQAKQPCP